MQSYDQYHSVCFLQGCESNRTTAVNITITPSSGQALDFDGTDDAVTVPTNTGFNAQKFHHRSMGKI